MSLGEKNQKQQLSVAQLDEFVGVESDSSLLQSWTWGEFQQKLGRTVARLSVHDSEGLTAVATVIMIKLPFGLSYTYVPRGPVAKAHALPEILSLVKKQAEEWGSTFIRIDPALPSSAAKLLESAGYQEAASQVQPRVTARLDLTKDRDEILASMKSKHRYNIRLSAKKGVVVRESVSPGDVEEFLKLLRQTTERDQFAAHEDDYYRKQVDVLGRAGLLKMYIATHEQDVLSAIVVGMHGQTATYLHGVSGNTKRNLMPTFAVQWEAIKHAERTGLRWYDFHGVSPTDDPSHAWAGITRFKLGFGASRHEYVGAYDLPLKDFAYKLYAWRTGIRKSDGR